MRIIVTSDSHRMARNLFDIVEKHIETTDLFINLGDGESDVNMLLATYPNLNIKRVCGNCDFSSSLPVEDFVTVNGKKIFFTHGHRYYVKFGYQMIEEYSEKIGADICLFGHTHVPYTQYKNGIYYMNPGAVLMSSYGIIDIEKNGIMIYNEKIL